jgi:hypothetical protein
VVVIDYNMVAGGDVQIRYGVIECSCASIFHDSIFDNDLEAM